MKIGIALMLILSLVFIPTVQADTSVELGFECPHIVYVGDTFQVKVWLDPHGQSVDAWVLGEVRYELLSCIDVKILEPWRKSYASPGEITNSPGAPFLGRVKDTQAFVFDVVDEKTEIFELTCVARHEGVAQLTMRNVDIAYDGNLYSDIPTFDTITVKVNESYDGNYNASQSFNPVARIKQINPFYDVGESIDFLSISYDIDGFIEWYHWDFGDSERVQNSRAVSHIYDSAGNYTVTLMVEDNSDNVDITSIDVQINATESPSDNPDDNTTTNPNDNQTNNNTNGTGNITDNKTQKEEFDYTYLLIVSAVTVGMTVFYYIGRRFWW